VIDWQPSGSHPYPTLNADDRQLNPGHSQLAVLSWTWRRPAPETVAVATPSATTVRFDLETAQKWDGLPTTVVRVTHDHVPRDWIDDLGA
jgi:hypothetical protein